ncbi:tachykinin-4 isoform X2 [Fukomys damarensis]|uniref:tachykinin-4 isoform X2 n=1 Tax=Fukomys damarensis TaxID=885580 RepID=UPI00053F3C53|nr:tachykinin-4 isoform X2 [Fukomys damarensis]
MLGVAGGWFLLPSCSCCHWPFQTGRGVTGKTRSDKLREGRTKLERPENRGASPTNTPAAKRRRSLWPAASSGGEGSRRVPDSVAPTMLPCLATLLLAGLYVCASAGHGGEKLALGTEERPWVTVALEEVPVPSIQLQLQEARRFFGLMGKRVGGVPRIQPEPAGHQRGRAVQGLLGRGGISTEGSGAALLSSNCDSL